MVCLKLWLNQSWSCIWRKTNCLVLKVMVFLAFGKRTSLNSPYFSEWQEMFWPFRLSTVAFESAFSVGGRVLDTYHNSLMPKIVESMICPRDWLYGQQAFMPVQHNVNDSCRVVMNMNVHDNEGSSPASKSQAGSGVGQNSALENQTL